MYKIAIFPFMSPNLLTVMLFPFLVNSIVALVVLVEEVESETQSTVSIVAVAASKAVADAELTILLLATSEVAGNER